MTFNSKHVINVYYLKGLEKLFMGRLALVERQIFFEYSAEFLQTGIELSPFKLPLKSGIKICADSLFDGLFGVFNDSLPDGWGRLLIDRKLTKAKINSTELSPLDRLRYVGSNGMGALIYEPATDTIDIQHYNSLDEIAKEISEFQEHDNDQFVEDLIAMSGSSAGARPKIITRLNAEDWIIKFRSAIDPKDIGPIEYAYHLMAKAAQLNTPDAQLFPAKNGYGYFGVKRFDRIGNTRLHMHTISGLLHADHHLPSLDYATIMKATLCLTKNIQECEKQLRATVFNVLTHNRDDHVKNFSFIMDTQGEWRVSPPYDLTFSSGPAGEHSSMIMGEGKYPTLAHILKLAAVCGIKKPKTIQIIDEVNSAVTTWKNLAINIGVSKKSYSVIQKTLDHVAKYFWQ